MTPWSRRRFLAATAGAAALPLAGAAAQNAPMIARRPLGKTGVEVSILGVGGGSQFLSATRTDEAAVEMLKTAFAGGITYFDNASGYGNHESERRYGLFLPSVRDQVFMTSKTQRRDRDAALRDVETSLTNLRTDHLDLIQIHSIVPEDDVDAILGPNGVYRALLQLREQKVVRFIGITGHSAATRMKTLVERMDVLDTVLCPVNPQRDSRHFVNEKDDANPDGHFEELLLSAARERGLGIIAMKSTAQGTLIGEGAGKASAATLIRYAMSEPGVATTIVGPGSLANMRENLHTAHHFEPLPDAERRRLVAQMTSPRARYACNLHHRDA